MIKLIKDIVHGYIEFEQDYIDIINTAEFQRLRNIRQTNYNSLYPSSLHDRFSHSLGVYAYGKYAFTNFQNNVKLDFISDPSLQDIDWEQKRRVFLRACLLHDIGHSPFSHTGEDFYLLRRVLSTKPKLSKEAYIYLELTKAVNLPSFTKDFDEKQLEKNDVAKPHEIMSAIIGIKRFLKDGFSSKEKDLFARMIIGLSYTESNNLDSGINNALIQLLNSSVIDVDRLDYLARDRLMTGFESARIDTDRLLASVCLANKSTDASNPNYHLGYYKNALSVIESVVVAHDGERKWMQSHAVVLYDSFLVQKCIEAVQSVYGHENEIFCEESLNQDGVAVNDGKSSPLIVRYLCDADILFLAKQIPADNQYRPLIDEYFSRNKRKKAIWKSEAEYDLMVREIGDADRKRVLQWLDHLFDNLPKGNRTDEKSVIINQQQEQIIKERTKQMVALGKIEEEDALKSENAILRKMSVFRSLAEKFDVEYDFVITYSNPFDSNAKKLISNDVLIKYKNFDLPKPIGEIISTYTLNENSFLQKIDTMKRIYFIYYKQKVGSKKRKKDNKNILPLDFINYLKDNINNPSEKISS